MKSKVQKLDVYVVYKNTDPTEGRGSDYPDLICESESTAIRLSKGAYVAGTDCPYKKDYIEFKHGSWRGPICSVPPSEEDEKADLALQEQREKQELKQKILAKAKKLGLTQKEIEVLTEEE